MDNKDKANLPENIVMNDPVFDFATKKELNVEAHTRAEGDGLLNSKFTQKIEDLYNKILNKDEKFNSLEEKISEGQDQIKTNDERITDLELKLLNQIRHLEEKNEELTLELEDMNQSVSDKNDELNRLQEEMANGDATIINLPFTNVPEFEISQVISVKEFINEYLKDLIVSRMTIRYPGTQFLTDYTIEIDGLDYNDIMQGKNALIFIRACKNGKLNGECNFEIKVNHKYSYFEQEKFIEEFLRPTIPVSLGNVAEKASPNYNVPNEIINTKPLKLLLHNKEFKNLSFKIFAEMNAASYWNDFHRTWQYIKEGYFGTGTSTIGQNTIINTVKNLYNTTLGYYNYIFKLIEQRLNDSGVKCTLTKKLVKHSRGSNLLHSLGNLTFNVTNVNLNNDDVVITQSHHYYIMLNFEVDLNNLKRLYRGVTLVLTDNLELY